MTPSPEHAETIATGSATAMIGGTRRATERPAGVKPPSGWTQDKGPPAPRAVAFVGQPVKGRPDPVRYGDWEVKGVDVDF